MPPRHFRDQIDATLGPLFGIERDLGGNKVSRTFLARELPTQRQVVLKVLTPGFGAGMSAERFAEASRPAMSLDYPGIIPVLRTGAKDGLTYYTMPFVDGISLKQRLTDSGQLPVGDATGVLRDIAGALVYAHGRGVVHHDLNPDNVVLTSDGAMVSEFGMAHAIGLAAQPILEGSLSGVGLSLGTPEYVAPEQSGDSVTDHRADLYAFGCLAFEVFTNEPPFRRKTVHQVMWAHAHEVPPVLAERRADVPAPIASLVGRCLEKDPSRRPASARELLGMLGSA